MQTPASVRYEMLLYVVVRSDWAQLQDATYYAIARAVVTMYGTKMQTALAMYSLLRYLGLIGQEMMYALSMRKAISAALARAWRVRPG